MRKKEQLFFTFFVFLVFSTLVLLLSKKGLTKTPQEIVQKTTIPIQVGVFRFFNNFSLFGPTQSVREEKELLFKKLVEQKKLEEDNKALRDQFETAKPASVKLLPARVIGAANFIPGVTSVETLTVDKGSDDGIKEGRAVVYKDNLVGKIFSVSPHLSTVLLVTNSHALFTGRTLQTNAQGVVKGAGNGTMIFSNVLLSENLILSDVVVTGGDLDSKGNGIPKDLIIGSIESVDKKPSALFQSCRIKSVLDFSKLSTVFVIMEY